jgi:hypothetical protein
MAMVGIIPAQLAQSSRAGHRLVERIPKRAISIWIAQPIDKARGAH